MIARKLHIVLFSLLVSGIFFCVRVEAQQESQYTQYIYNTMSINPAYTGGRGRLSTMALYRSQWVGLDGAPQTLNISGHSPLPSEPRVGLGLEFTHDKIGPATTSLAAANFSYVFPISNEVQLAFGMKAGLSNLNLDLNKLNIYDQNNLDLTINDRMMPIFGFGTYIYGKNWYLGLSSPNFLETKHYEDVKVSTAKEKMHLYLIAGYLIEIQDEFALKPSVLVKAVQGSPLALDLSLNAIFYDRFSIGAAYRTSAAISAMAGFQINDFIMIGYAYDYSTSSLSRYNSGSHEIFLRFELAELRDAVFSRGSGPSF